MPARTLSFPFRLHAIKRERQIDDGKREFSTPGILTTPPLTPPSLFLNQPTKLNTNLRPAERVKALIRVPNKGQTGCILVFVCLCGLRPVSSRSIILVNLVNGEVLSIDVGLQFGFEGRADTAETVPGDAAEEGVLFDFVGAADATEAVFGVTDEPGRVS